MWIHTNYGFSTHICRTHIQGLECPRDCNARFGYRWEVQRHLNTFHQEDEEFIGPMQLQNVSKIKHYQHNLFTSRRHWNYETKRQICRAQSLEDLMQIDQLQRVRTTLLSPATWSSSREGEHRPPQLAVPEHTGTPLGVPSDTSIPVRHPPDTVQPLQQTPGDHLSSMDIESDTRNSGLVLSNARATIICEFVRAMRQTYIEDSRSHPMDWGHYALETLGYTLDYAYKFESQSSMSWHSPITHADYAQLRQMQSGEFEGSDSGYTTGTLSYARQDV